jgi:hypothetical protein
VTNFSTFQTRSHFSWQFLSNPGVLYNCGNGLAIFGSALLFVFLANSHRDASMWGHFLGSWPAVATTAASVIFWIGGMQYAKAWNKGFPPAAKANNAGHALSTLGALIIGIALIGLARSEVALALAIIATILHTGGKLVSWYAPEADDYFKPMPLYSRVPYVTTLFLDMRSDVMANTAIAAIPSVVVLPFFLVLATAFWARADWLLLQKAK